MQLTLPVVPQPVNLGPPLPSPAAFLHSLCCVAKAFYYSDGASLQLDVLDYAGFAFLGTTFFGQSAFSAPVFAITALADPTDRRTSRLRGTQEGVVLLRLPAGIPNPESEVGLNGTPVFWDLAAGGIIFADASYPLAAPAAFRIGAIYAPEGPLAARPSPVEPSIWVLPVQLDDLEGVQLALAFSVATTLPGAVGPLVLIPPTTNLSLASGVGLYVPGSIAAPIAPVFPGVDAAFTALRLPPGTEVVTQHDGTILPGATAVTFDSVGRATTASNPLAPATPGLWVIGDSESTAFGEPRWEWNPRFSPSYTAT